MARGVHCNSCTQHRGGDDMQHRRRRRRIGLHDLLEGTGEAAPSEASEIVGALIAIILLALANAALVGSAMAITA